MPASNEGERFLWKGSPPSQRFFCTFRRDTGSNPQEGFLNIICRGYTSQRIQEGPPCYKFGLENSPPCQWRYNCPLHSAVISRLHFKSCALIKCDPSPNAPQWTKMLADPWQPAWSTCAPCIKNLTWYLLPGTQINIFLSVVIFVFVYPPQWPAAYISRIHETCLSSLHLSSKVYPAARPLPSYICLMYTPRKLTSYTFSSDT